MAEDKPDKVDFSGLVAGLATSAVAVLSQVERLGTPEGAKERAANGEERSLSPAEVKKRAAEGLKGARQLIDTLAMLEEKTAGNLSEDEQELLRTSISELRLRYVSLTNRPVGEASEKEDVPG